MATRTRKTATALRAGTRTRPLPARVITRPRQQSTPELSVPSDEQPEPEQLPLPEEDPEDPDGNPDDEPNPDGQPDPDDEPPQGNDGDDDDPDHRRELARALTLLARNTERTGDSHASKVREPDQFDGSDTRKLRTFLFQLELNFKDRPKTFRRDEARVTFALSFLKGTALDWFEPAIVNDADRPIWADDYSAFVHELRTNFGPHDPTGDAEAEIEQLRMRENHRITKYLVDFNRLAAQLDWGQSALRHQLYRGLPARIKDEIARVGKPDTLEGLRTLAQRIDSRYWERRAEVSRETPAPNKSEKSEKSGHSKSEQKKPEKGSNSNQNSNPKSQNQSSGSRKSDKSNKSANSGDQQRKTDISSKLGKDGKLLPEERQRRFDNNLCLRCGGSGHVAKDCTKSASSDSTKTKARAGKVQAKSEPAPPASDAKKD